MARLILNLLNLVSFVVLVSVALSWFPTAREHPVGRAITSMTEPLFERIRRVVPPAGGMDLSPMIVLIALQVLRALLR